MSNDTNYLSDDQSSQPILDREVQDLLQDEFFSNTESVSNDMVLNLMFMRHYGNSLSSKQIQAIMLLKSYGSEFNDIIDHALLMRKETTSSKKFFKMIDKFTMADKIKGNAKLKDIFKASAANPSTHVSMGDYQAKEMNTRDLR